MMSTPGDVISTKLKLTGDPRFHAATVVGSSAAGTWLFSPAGTVVSGPSGSVGTQPADGVQFFPTDVLPMSRVWYVAWCWAVAPEPTSPHWARPWISVDIAAREADRFSFLDLELDLWCDESGAGVVDQEDLDAVEAAGRLSPGAAARARLASEELYQDLRAGCRDAFDGEGWSVLEAARGRPAHRA